MRVSQTAVLSRQADTVSLLVPVYNAEAHLPSFISCMKKQTYINWELLLLDDGSDDSSSFLCDRYAAEDPRIRVFHLAHGGVARARNRGLEMYTGKYLMFADADDLISSNYIERLYELITNADVHAVTCVATDVRDAELEDYEYLGKKSEPVQCIWGEVDYRTRESHRVIWGAIYDRYAVEGIRFEEQYHVSTDTLFFTRVFQRIGTYIQVNEPLYCYVMYSASVSHRPPDRKRYDDILVWREIYAMLPDTGISHESCQYTILRKYKDILKNIMNAEDGDRKLYKDICRDIRHFSPGILTADPRSNLKNQFFLHAPGLYMKLYGMKNRRKK